MKLSISNFSYKRSNSYYDFQLEISNFEIKQHEIVFIFGHSGSGKSTLFNLLAGILESSIKQEVINTFQRIEYIMHNSKLLPWHTLLNNIKVINRLNQNVDIPTVIKYCENLGLDSKSILQMKSWQLSLGMRQRFEIALALSNSPDFIILDEALSGIDNKHKQIVCREIHKYIKSHNTCFLGTAHQISDVLRLADRVIFINNGKIENSIQITSYSIEDRIKMTFKELYTLPELEYLIDV